MGNLYISASGRAGVLKYILLLLLKGLVSTVLFLISPYQQVDDIIGKHKTFNLINIWHYNMLQISPKLLNSLEIKHI